MNYTDLVALVQSLQAQVKSLTSQKNMADLELSHKLDVMGARDAWQIGRSDNVQSGYPLVLRLYIPEGSDTKSIKKVLLNVWPDSFRSYGTAAALGGGTTTGPSVADTTGPSVADTTGPNVADTTGPSVADTTGSSSASTTADAGHSHTIGSMITSQDDGSVGLHTHSTPISYTFTDGTHTHPMAHTHTLNSHTHTLNSHTHTLNSHTHTLNSHTHTLNSHTHTLNSHTHTLNHTHGIAHGIYVDAGTASGMTITINSVDRTNALVGAATFDAAQTNLDITVYVTKGLNTISIASATLGRIEAMIFANVYLNG